MALSRPVVHDRPGNPKAPIHMLALMGLGSQELLLIFLVLSIPVLLPLWALVDVVRSNFRGQNDKLIWVIIIVFMNFIGAALYFFVGRNQRVA